MAEKKRKKSYYLAPRPKREKRAWKGELCPGMTGILISTNDQEKLCVPEAYNLLNEYADQLYGPEIVSDEGDDIATSLAEEVDRLRRSELKPRRFQAISSGTKHVVFVQCQPPVDPVGLVHHILSDVLKTKLCKSRFCQRFIPVSVVCRATTEAIEKHVTDVLAPHFYQHDILLKFAVVYKARNNKDVNREGIIKTLASLATRSGDYSHTVDLSNPDLTILVEILKSNCCISVVRDFHKLKKYNIHSIMEDSSKENTNEAKVSISEVSEQSEDNKKDCVTKYKDIVDTDDTVSLDRSCENTTGDTVGSTQGACMPASSSHEVCNEVEGTPN